MMRVRKAKPQKKKKNIILRIAIAAFSVYAIIAALSGVIQLINKENYYEQLAEEIRNQEVINESLKEKSENSEIYLEEEARDQGYVLPGEQVYQPVPGE